MDVDCKDMHQSPSGSSVEEEKPIFSWSVFHMDGHPMKQACSYHFFFSEINLLASGLLRASELSFGDFPFIKHSEQKRSSRIIAQCLQHLLGGSLCLIFFNILKIIPFYHLANS